MAGNRSITVTLRANVQDFKSQFDAATKAAEQAAKRKQWAWQDVSVCSWDSRPPPLGGLPLRAFSHSPRAPVPGVSSANQWVTAIAVSSFSSALPLQDAPSLPYAMT